MQDLNHLWMFVSLQLISLWWIFQTVSSIYWNVLYIIFIKSHPNGQQLPENLTLSYLKSIMTDEPVPVSPLLLLSPSSGATTLCSTSTIPAFSDSTNEWHRHHLLFCTWLILCHMVSSFICAFFTILWEDLFSLL